MKTITFRAIFIALLATSPYWLSQNAVAQSNDFQPAAQQTKQTEPAEAEAEADQEPTELNEFAPTTPVESSLAPTELKTAVDHNHIQQSTGTESESCPQEICPPLTTSQPLRPIVSESPKVKLASFESDPTADENRPVYQLDNDHTSLVFAVGHGNFSFVYGRFNRCWGRFWLDEKNPTNSRFEFSIDTASIDTNNDERDKHLRGPDFFSVQQFPMIKFKSDSVLMDEDTYVAVGTLSMLGKEKEFRIPFRLIGKGKGVFGKERAGFFAKFPIKRSDFGMDKMLASGVGNNIAITFSFEGIKETSTPKEARNTLPISRKPASPNTSPKPSSSNLDDLKLGEVPDNANLNTILNLPDAPTIKK